MTRIAKGTKTISLDWGQNGGYGSLKLTSDGTFGYLAFLVDNPTFASQIKVGDVIQINQAGNNIGSGTVLGPYETFSNTTVESPHQDWTGIKGFKLSNNYELAPGFPADLNIDGFVVTLQRGVKIIGGLRLGATSTPPPSGATITIPDLSNVVSGPVSGSTYINGGGYDYVVFGSSPTLTGAIISQYSIIPDNSGFFGPHPVTWSSGSTNPSGYVYLQVTTTSDFQFYSSDVDGNPVAGTWVFPMTFQ